jgi:hypothetical protein
VSATWSTTKQAKHTDTQDKLFPIYNIQLNSYAFMGERLKTHQSVRSLTLVYYEPVSDDDAASERKNWMADGFKMRFKADLVPVTLNLDKIPPLLQQVRKIADIKQAPSGARNCKDCLQVSSLYRVAPPEPVSAFITKLESSIALVQARKRHPDERVKEAQGAQ